MAPSACLASKSMTQMPLHGAHDTLAHGKKPPAADRA
ncbi:BgTH12-03083 [Blumeria graminis f. sp. triticale]|uniref:Bgt-50265 n=2 Tax=Blumeria graminis TaxID=34373 RepID=A0A9X9MJ17_BLUGR|nr:BgTH12-03083 [Blumeria graminis f. sp. triticale]VDB89507.1 Bgt-50265 [Blumeria graminis f. sp. tritici]